MLINVRQERKTEQYLKKKEHQQPNAVLEDDSPEDSLDDNFKNCSDENPA